MNWTLILNALTAFIISGGGAVGIVAASGNTLNKTVYTLAVVVGLVSAAKDVRSQLNLPPIDLADSKIGGGSSANLTKPTDTTTPKP